MKALVLTCTFLFFGFFSSGQEATKRFILSNLYEKGDYEIHVFNNYYSQLDKLDLSTEFNSRYDFFTMTGQFLVGISSKVNIGFDLKFRSVSQNVLDKAGKFKALQFKNEGFLSENGNYAGYSRTGFSLMGPKIKYQVFPELGSFSMIHTLLIPIAKDLGGNDQTGYLDWGSPVLTNQILFDKNMNTKWSLFAELGFFVENINNSLLKKEDGFYQISTPSTLILSYYPINKTTIYGLLSYAGRWENSVLNSLTNTNYNPYYQWGLGLKYWISNRIEAELIFTSFEDESSERTASTINLGIRYFSNR